MTPILSVQEEEMQATTVTWLASCLLANVVVASSLIHDVLYRPITTHFSGSFSNFSKELFGRTPADVYFE